MKRCNSCGQVIPDKTPGTEQQNRAMHPLLVEYYKTGMHSAPESVRTLGEFKVYMKLQYGPPPLDVPIEGEKYRVLKSWAHYTKTERGEFIDGLLAEIYQACTPLTARLEEIIKGMEEL